MTLFVCALQFAGRAGLAGVGSICLCLPARLHIIVIGLHGLHTLRVKRT